MVLEDSFCHESMGKHWISAVIKSLTLKTFAVCLFPDVKRLNWPCAVSPLKQNLKSNSSSSQKKWLAKRPHGVLQCTLNVAAQKAVSLWALSYISLTPSHFVSARSQVSPSLFAAFDVQQSCIHSISSIIGHLSHSKWIKTPNMALAASKRLKWKWDLRRETATVCSAAAVKRHGRCSV